MEREEKAGGKACVKALRSENRPGFSSDPRIGWNKIWLVRLAVGRGRMNHRGFWAREGQGVQGSPHFPGRRKHADGTVEGSGFGG